MTGETECYENVVCYRCDSEPNKCLKSCDMTTMVSYGHESSIPLLQAMFFLCGATRHDMVTIRAYLDCFRQFTTPQLCVSQKLVAWQTYNKLRKPSKQRAKFLCQVVANCGSNPNRPIYEYSRLYQPMDLHIIGVPWRNAQCLN